MRRDVFFIDCTNIADRHIAEIVEVCLLAVSVPFAGKKTLAALPGKSEPHSADACEKVDEGEGRLLRTLRLFKKRKKGFRSDCVDGFSCSCRICCKLFSDAVAYRQMDLFCHTITFWDDSGIISFPIIGYVHKKCKRYDRAFLVVYWISC